MSQAQHLLPPPTPQDMQLVMDRLNRLCDSLTNCRVKVGICGDRLLGPAPTSSTNSVTGGNTKPEGIVHEMHSRLVYLEITAQDIFEAAQRIDYAIGGPS